MGLGKDDDVIEALAPDAAQKSLAHRVHERRPHRGAQDASSGALGNAVEGRTELVVPIADDELRTLPEGGRVGARVTPTCTTRFAFTSTTKNAKMGRNQMS